MNSALPWLVEQGYPVTHGLSVDQTPAMCVEWKALADVKVKSVKKKMKAKAFAASVNRDDITNGAAAIGVELADHIAFVLEALQGIAGELGLDGGAAAAADH